MSEETPHELSVTPRLPEPVFTLQEWLAHRVTPTLNNKPLRYAKWWINKHLVSPSEALQSLDFDGGHCLYVTIAGDRYRVLTVNRYGVFKLILLFGESAPDGKAPIPQACNIAMRNETDFTEWSNTPEGPLNESKFVPYIPSHNSPTSSSGNHHEQG